jgi:periplasmic protein TonB
MCLAQSLPLQALETTVRCTNCETEPLKVARYCECCGRELLAGQTSHNAAQATKAEAATDVDDWAPKPHRNADLRCPSCGGPSLDGNRCAACRAADSSMEHRPSTTHEAQSVDQRGSTASRVTVAPASQEAMHVTPAHAGSPVPSEDAAAAPEKASEPEIPKAPAPPRRTAADAIYAEMLQRAASPMPTPPRRPAVAPQTAPTAEHNQASVASDHKQRPIVLASFGVLVVALVAGAYSIRSHEQPVRAQQQSPASVVAENNVTDAAGSEHDVPSAAPVTPKPIPPSPVPERKPVRADEHQPAPSTPSVSQKPAPAAPRKDSAAVRANATTPARSPRAAAAPATVDKSTRPRGPASDVPAGVVTFSPAAERPAVAVAGSGRQPEPEAPAAAVGPIFDLRDVSEQPKIATQHAPSLPPELRSRATKEIVVVRALVSQSGRPSRISLLRRSKTGPEVDDVILASVNQWTFSPARKKGEAVNCWFNFAVQVGGTD